MNDPTFESVEARAGGEALWVLRAQRASRLPAPAFGLLSGALTAGVVLLPIILGVSADAEDVLLSAAFFGMSIAVLTGFTPHIFYGAARDLQELAPVIPLADDEAKELGRALVRMPRRSMLLYTLLGVAMGLLHCWLLGVFGLGGLSRLTQGFSTLTLWIAMFWTIPPLLSNAEIFSWLGGRAEVDLLRPHRLAPFGATAVRPTLFVIGMLCAYPILVLPAEHGLSLASLLGFAASIASMFGLFFLPLRGIRRSILSARGEALARLDERLEIDGEIAGQDADRLREIVSLLSLRDRVAHVSSWPLDLAGIRRILLYVVLPPVTWTAAAMIEMLVNQQF